MRLEQPRVAPLPEDRWSEDVRKLLQPNVEKGTVFNIFRTLAVYPTLMRRWMVFANHVLFKSSLGARERELVILRIGWLCRDAFISDSTWAKLSAHFSTEQLMDIVFAVGQYNLVSMVLNTLGVQLDEGLQGLEHP